MPVVVYLFIFIHVYIASNVHILIVNKWLFVLCNISDIDYGRQSVHVFDIIE